MTRFLPIALLALGLALAFTSLAAAATSQEVAPAMDAICLEEPQQAAEIRQPAPEKKFARCWRQIKMGLLVTPCPIDPGLCLEGANVPEQPYALMVPGASGHKASDDGVKLVLPPPRA